MSVADPESERSGPGTPLPTRLSELRERLERARNQQDGASDPDTLFVDLETAYEELRVADEEVRTQQEHIAQLTEGQDMLRWQHERMMSVLPVPVMTTDSHGIIRAVNAAAAGMMEMRVARLLGKPILSLVAPEERPHLRRLLFGQARTARSFSRLTTLIRRDGAPLEVEATASVLPGLEPETTWMLLDAPGGDPEPDGRSDVLPQALADLSRLSAVSNDVQDLLRRAVTECERALGKGVEVTVTLGPPAEPSALASSGSAAQSLDGAQVVHGQGPWVSAFETRTTVVTPDLRHDERWPALAADVPAQIGAAVAIPLETGDRLVGALNVYALSTGVDPSLVRTAELLGATIAAILYEFGLRSELQQLAGDMERALTSRAVIDQAKGVVMAELGCTADEAFQHLVQLSSSQQLKLREVAQRLVTQRAGG